MPGPDYHAWTHLPDGTDPIDFPASAAAGGRFVIKVFHDTQNVTTGDGKFIFAIPEDLDAHVLVHAHAFVSVASTSGLPLIQIRNVTDSVDMLSTRITIDVGEFTSYTATTPPVINTANDDVTTGDRIAVDVDTAGLNTRGLGVILHFDPL